MKNAKLLLSLGLILTITQIDAVKIAAEIESNKVNEILKDLKNFKDKCAQYHFETICDTHVESLKDELQKIPAENESFRQHLENQINLINYAKKYNIEDPKAVEEIQEKFGPLLNKRIRAEMTTAEGKEIKIYDETGTKETVIESKAKAESTFNSITSYLQTHPWQTTFFSAAIIGGIVYIYQTYYQDQDRDHITYN